MRAYIVLAWLAALLTMGGVVLCGWRWLAIRRRPRVTCDNVAALVGKAVLLVGRTAAARS